MRSPPSSRSGACVFAVNPDLRATETQIFWSPTIDPSVIVIGLSPTASDTPSALRAALEQAQIVSPENPRLRLLRIGAILYPIFITPDVTPDDGLAAIALFDALLPDRLETISRFWKGLRHPSPPNWMMTAQRRSRLLSILRVFDARRDRNSYRAIAEVLFPKHRIDKRSWAGNALRETTIRLARDATKLVAEGYRSLLHRSRKH